MQVSIKIDPKLLSTPVPNFFIDNFMLNAKPIFSLVYIYIYKKCVFENKKIDINNIAEKFNIQESDIIDSLIYWQAKKLILYNKTDKDIFIEFLMPQIISQESQVDINKFNNTCPSYGAEEINLYENDPNIHELFDFAQNLLGRYLGYSDLNTIFMFYDFLKMPIDLIKFLISYCVDNGHKSLAYIEKVAISWSEQKINSVQDAKEKVLDLNKLLANIKKSLAVTSLNQKQRDFFCDWKKKFNMPDDLIIEACNITMMNIGRPNYKYINSILESWLKNNIKTLSEAKNLKYDFYNNNKHKEKLRRNKFANFEQRTWDFKKIERIAQGDFD